MELQNHSQKLKLKLQLKLQEIKFINDFQMLNYPTLTLHELLVNIKKKKKTNSLISRTYPNHSIDRAAKSNHASNQKYTFCFILYKRTVVASRTSQYSFNLVRTAESLRFPLSNRWTWSTSSISCKSWAKDGSAKSCWPSIEAPRPKWCSRLCPRRTPASRTSFASSITVYTWPRTETS